MSVRLAGERAHWSCNYLIWIQKISMQNMVYAVGQRLIHQRSPGAAAPPCAPPAGPRAGGGGRRWPGGRGPAGWARAGPQTRHRCVWLGFVGVGAGFVSAGRAMRSLRNNRSVKLVTIRGSPSAARTKRRACQTKQSTHLAPAGSNWGTGRALNSVLGASWRGAGWVCV